MKELLSLINIVAVHCATIEHIIEQVQQAISEGSNYKELENDQKLSVVLNYLMYDLITPALKIMAKEVDKVKDYKESNRKHEAICLYVDTADRSVRVEKLVTLYNERITKRIN